MYVIIAIMTSIRKGIIDSTTDKDAHKTSRGDWMCGVCTIEGLLKMNKGGGINMTFVSNHGV
jgi:hypothetical protein